MYDQLEIRNVELRGIPELKSSEPKSFPFTYLLSHVNLTDTEDNRLEIAFEDFSVIKSDVAKLVQPAPRRRSRDISNSQFATDDGIARILVHGTGHKSSQVKAYGLRRSSRTMTAVFFYS